MDSFRITTDDLGELFSQDDTKKGACMKELTDRNGVVGICEALKTSMSHGIDPENPPIANRIEHFGDNKPFQYKQKSLLHFVCENLSDPVLQILIGAAAISLIIGMIQEPSDGWLEGTAILVAVVIVISVASTNDYMKEKQFIKLNADTDTHRVIVTRNGLQHEISAHDLVVGDLMCISPGDILPADGILISGHGLRIDESNITGESRLIKKDPMRAGDTNSNPFLISGSSVSDGSGWIIVCNVGRHSVMGRNRLLTGEVEDDNDTPLSERLTVIANGLGKLGFVAGALLTVVLLIYTAVDGISNSAWGDDEWSNVVQAIILGITILVVAIPEGLPLALTLSMAYSILRMKSENIFVRHLKGCEIMGAATNILSDKTGTLTQNKMSVTRSVLFGKEIGKGIAFLSDNEKALIAETVARNSTAFLSESPSGKVEMIGNKTECALLMMIQQWGLGYEIFRNYDKQMFQYAFSSNTKRMTTVYDLDAAGIAVYCKGAGEIVLDFCTHTMTPQGKVPLTPELRASYIGQFSMLASECLRVIGLAYQNTNAQEIGDGSQETVERDMTFLGFVGIEDPLRPESRACVIKSQIAGVTVRMLTGDSIETAVKISKMCGILPEDIAEDEIPDYIMEGAELRSRVGGLNTALDEEGKVKSHSVNNMDEFRKIMCKLRVIARCSPEDKLLLVVGLREMGEVVGVTGDGSNDAPALKQCDIGLAMMSGTPLAKESSDIILLDDNFESVLNSIKWGRNVYASIRKFLQFQITVNVVALIVSIVGALTVKDSPLTAVQMLWVNLIMDSMAALALATEPPNETLLHTRPFGRTESIITSDMYINMMSQSVYQVAVLLTLLYAAPALFDIEEGWNHDNWSEDNGRHFTIFFQTFVMLQLFNEINCRKLQMDEWNFFTQFFNNWMFIAILIVTFGVQLALVELGGEALKCSGLTLEQHLVCLLIGVAGLIFSLIVRVSVCAFRNAQSKKGELEEEKRLLS